MNEQGIYCPVPQGTGDATGRCISLITGGENAGDHIDRTMFTHLGISDRLGAKDVSRATVENADILLLEGYGYGTPSFYRGIAWARSKTRTALTLSDYRVVARCRKAFNELAKGPVEIILGNEREIKALTGCDDFNKAVATLEERPIITVITRGAEGALILDNGNQHVIKAEKVGKVVDTTGAGDAFAAGLLFGISQGMTMDEAGHLGAVAAAHTIGHVGARSKGVKFSELAR
jgi:sugar/nucleoside kinase (ribokinase family)